MDSKTEQKKPEFEYRVWSPYRDTSSTTDPAHAGEKYRKARKNQFHGETIELQQRPITPWETIERSDPTNGSQPQPKWYE